MSTRTTKGLFQGYRRQQNKRQTRLPFPMIPLHDTRRMQLSTLNDPRAVGTIDNGEWFFLSRITPVSFCKIVHPECVASRLKCQWIDVAFVVVSADSIEIAQRSVGRRT